MRELGHRRLADVMRPAIRAGVPPSTYFVPAELDTLTRRHLRESFRAIAAVQARVDRDWMRRLER